MAGADEDSMSNALDVLVEGTLERGIADFNRSISRGLDVQLVVVLHIEAKIHQKQFDTHKCHLRSLTSSSWTHGCKFEIKRLVAHRAQALRPSLCTQGLVP